MHLGASGPLKLDTVSTLGLSLSSCAEKVKNCDASSGGDEKHVWSVSMQWYKNGQRSKARGMAHPVCMATKPNSGKKCSKLAIEFQG